MLFWDVEHCWIIFIFIFDSIHCLNILGKNSPNDLAAWLPPKIKIFNCELHDAKPLGMVDVGVIHKFSGSTTGDRFAGGLVGYALEMAIDDVWTKSSKQEEAVNDVKLKLIQKTLSIYPDVNMLFNFDVDFREMGSTGSVFIYMRATAAIGKNSLTDVAKKELEKEI